MRLLGLLLNRRGALVLPVLALTACGAGISADGTEPSGEALRATATAVCSSLDIVAADPSSAVAVFQNDAHDGLHALAAAPALDRSDAARLLEAKARVEGAISGGAPSQDLREDLAELVAATEAALADLGLKPESCGADRDAGQ